MAAIIEFTAHDDADNIIASPIWDHIPRVGEQVMLRTDGPYSFYEITKVMHVCDGQLRDDPVPHVAVYIRGIPDQF